MPNTPINLPKPNQPSIPPFTPHTWTAGEEITLEKINHIEQGIAVNSVFIMPIVYETTQTGNTYTESYSVDNTTIQNLITNFNNGELCFCIYKSDTQIYLQQIYIIETGTYNDVSYIQINASDFTLYYDENNDIWEYEDTWTEEVAQ